MDIDKINEELKLTLNELSDNLKQSYIAGRQAQADKALAKLNKAKQQVKNADVRYINKLPQGIDKETATDALEDLKYEMRRIDSGSDWRLEENDGWLCLSVRYWGNWSNPEDADDEEDYDWQELDDDYREKLNNILSNIQKKYGVKIHEPGSEKNWLDFEIKITKMNKNSMFSYEDEKAWKEFLQQIRAKDITGPIQKKRGKLVAEIPWIGGGDYALHMNPTENGFTCFIRSPRGVYEPLRINEIDSFKNTLNKVLDFCQKRMAKLKGAKNS